MGCSMCAVPRCAVDRRGPGGADTRESKTRAVAAFTRLPTTLFLLFQKTNLSHLCAARSSLHGTSASLRSTPGRRGPARRRGGGWWGAFFFSGGRKRGRSGVPATHSLQLSLFFLLSSSSPKNPMVDYSDLTYADLQKACKQRGIPARG